MPTIIIITLNELPERCCDCPCCNSSNGTCGAIEEYRVSDWRPFWCPLKEYSNNDSPSVIIKSQNDNVCNTGTWLSEYDDKFGFHYVCSECGTISGVRLKFCFDCGADMRGDEP